MEKEVFDVLVVYSERLATSANTLKDHALLPFAKYSRNASYNVVYSHFLKVCQRNKLKVAFTTSGDIIGPGTCSSYWLFQKTGWVKVKKVGYSRQIFDKCSPINRKIKISRNLLFSSKKVKPFNNPELFNLFFDKLKTYKKLSRYSIPTATVKESTAKSITETLKTLKRIIKSHPHREDFSNDIVIKDRFGAGGLNVYKLKSDETEKILRLTKKYANKSFIIQTFINFDKGFSYKKVTAATDIRLIYFRGKIIQTYIRMAKAGEFRCNEHQGGTVKYITTKQIPRDVLSKSDTIARLLNKKVSLFALDFIISNNGNSYFLEGNTGPGLDWDLANTKNKLAAQKLINIIVQELVRLVKPTGLIKNMSWKTFSSRSTTEVFA